MTRRAAWSVALGLAAAVAFGAAPVEARQVGVQEVADGIHLNFQDLDLAYVFTALAQAGGINLFYHDIPPKPVTLRTTHAIPRDEIPQLIRVLAWANGVAVTEELGFLSLRGTVGPDEPDARELYIYRLRHARASVLGATLQALFGGALPPTAAPGPGTTLSQQLRQLQQPQAPQAMQFQTGTPQGIVISTRGGAGELLGNVLIVPEEVTNSLLIRASPADWAIIEQAVAALDLRPLQVVIEVVIAEVRRTSDLDIGVAFGLSRETGRTAVEGGLPSRETTPEDAFSLRIAHAGNVDVEAALSALAGTGDVRILSRPVVLAQNNQQARILVGTQRPFVQVSRSLPTDEAVRDQVVQYREVGTALTILPTINEDGYVNLAVAQEVSSATAEIQFGAPVISTREATTQLLARNGQTVVLGGLVDRQSDRSHVGIPVLKDLPVLGHLFGTTRETTGNSELFLFLTPYIVASDDDAERLRDRIEGDAELLRPFLPVVPLTPPVVIPDTSGVVGR